MSGEGKVRPDSARSWAVAGAAFVINILLSGISRTTGLFYVSLIGTYGVTRMEANMPFTLRNIVRNLLGPVVGVIGHRYGAREVTMTGGMFAAFGIALCSIAPSMTWISFFWGGMHGLGVAMGNTLFHVIVSQYFEKNRATANGFAFSGGCVGSFIFPMILEYLLTNFGLAGTFLLTGAVVLLVVPAGILMKEPPWIKKEEKTSSEKETKTDIQNVETGKSKNRTTNGVLVTQEKSDEIFAIAYKRIPSNRDIELKCDVCKDGICNPVFEENNDIQNLEQKMPSFFFQEEKMEIKSSASEKGAPLQVHSIYEGAIQMFRDPMFHMISFSLAAFWIPFDFSLRVIVDYLKNKGLQEQSGKYFISMASVGDFIGRLGFGWVTDRNFMSTARSMMLLHVVQGLSFMLMPYFYTLDSIMILVVISNIAGGANVVMYPILVTKYLPSVQSLSIGCISFFGGIVQIGVPFMIGYFRDNFGSYDALYFIFGGMAIVTGLLWLSEPLLLNLKTTQTDCMSADKTNAVSHSEHKL